MPLNDDAFVAKHLPGDFAECGVYRGGSALMLCRILQETRKTFYLFDSFQGLPQPHPKHDKSLRAGELACDLESVKQRLAGFRRFTEFREGWIPETFQGLGDRRYAFAHIDV